MRRILIIEDNVNDLGYYAPLFVDGNEVSLLFFPHDQKYDVEKLENLVELLHEGLFKKVRKYYVAGEETMVEFLKGTSFDLYIFDSLTGLAPKFAKEAKLPKDTLAFFTSTEDFKNAMEKKGYKAYKKSEMERLMQENGLKE